MSAGMLSRSRGRAPSTQGFLFATPCEAKALRRWRGSEPLGSGVRCPRDAIGLSRSDARPPEGAFAEGYGISIAIGARFRCAIGPQPPDRPPRCDGRLCQCRSAQRPTNMQEEPCVHTLLSPPVRPRAKIAGAWDEPADASTIGHAGRWAHSALQKWLAGAGGTQKEMSWDYLRRLVGIT